jgi:signal transduction histidine kinase/DNA-binding response OmpR family regulator/ligand-binding sensor domain-containing protein
MAIYRYLNDDWQMNSCNFGELKLPVLLVQTIYKFVLVISVIALTAIHVLAQDGYSVTHLDNSNGLTNNSVNSVFSDSDELMWFSTWDGLNVYNGSSFQSFRSFGRDTSSSLPDNTITKVLESGDRNIWITTERGVTKYNKEDGLLHHYFYNGIAGKSLSSADYLLTIGPLNTVICGLRLDSALYCFDKRENTFVPLKLVSDNIGKIAEIEFDNKGRLWTLSIGGCLQVYEKKNDAYHLLHRIFSPTGINIFQIVNDRIFYVDGKKALCEVTQGFKMKEVIKIPQFIQGVQYFRGHYLIAWRYKGLQEFDETFKPIKDLINYCPQLNNIQVTSMLVTGDQILWLSTDDNGVFKFSKNKNSFGLAQKLPGSAALNTRIQTFNRVGDELWVGTKNNGIVKIRNFGGPDARYEVIKPVSSSYDPKYNSFYVLKNGADGLVYIGSDAFGVTLYDQSTKTFSPWEKIQDAVNNVDFYSIRCLLRDNDGSMFAGYGNGVAHFKVVRANNGKLKLAYLKDFKNTTRFLNKGNNLVSSLADRENSVLVGYRYGGLSLLNKKTGKFRDIATHYDKGALSNNNIITLFKDRRQRVWIGTANGLNVINSRDIDNKKPLFKQLHMENGLPNNFIQAIAEDNYGNIWVSTNGGLAKIEGQSLRVTPYTADEGLQNKEFSSNAVWKDSVGNLYFGGIAGFNYFNPGDVTIRKKPANLLISELSFGGKALKGVQLLVIRQSDTLSPKHYDVPRSSNFFSLRIQTANGYENKQVQYKYFLDGYDNQWHFLNESSRIDYNLLPPGDYRFLVVWSNGEGGWTAKREVFSLTVKQYFWLSGFAKTLYLAILAGLIYVLYRDQRIRQEEKKRALIENTIREKEKSMFQEKLDFFTNIAHELLTPLTIILGSLERFFSKNKKAEAKSDGWNLLQIASNEAFRLQYLTQQLLEFRKAESGHLVNHFELFNATSFLKNITTLFEPLREQKDLGFSVNISDNIHLYSDRDKIEKIVFNLLSNAFKYTENGNEIVFNVERYGQDSGIRMTIANSGYNHPLSDLSLLFEQFYTLNHNNSLKISSGIGLALTKQLTELLKGEINVKTGDNWITFTVLIPSETVGSQTSDVPVISSDKPSHLLRSLTNTKELFPDNPVLNNEYSLIENLETANKKSILLVEDESVLRYLLKDLLSEKYIVYEANSGKSAISLLKKIIPTLIISDVLMDDMDGLQLCSIIKNTIETCHIPFLLLSARVSAEQKIEGFETGADGYLTKPYNPAVLLKKVEEMIRYNEHVKMVLHKDPNLQMNQLAGLKSGDSEFLDGVIRLIGTQLDNPDLDAGFIENELSLSKMTLYRKTKELTNMTPSELIRHLRLKRSAALLTTTSLSVSEIYYQTGFNNQSYFYREFKKMYGFSPMDYRKQYELKTPRD